jgi:hypothetical protein
MIGRSSLLPPPTAVHACEDVHDTDERVAEARIG